MNNEVTYFPQDRNHSECWTAGTGDETQIAMGAEPVGLQGIQDALENIDSEHVVVAVYGAWEAYLWNRQWAAFRTETQLLIDRIEEYKFQIEEGDISEEDAIDELFSEIQDSGAINGIYGVSFSVGREPSGPANI